MRKLLGALAIVLCLSVLAGAEPTCAFGIHIEGFNVRISGPERGSFLYVQQARPSEVPLLPFRMYTFPNPDGFQDSQVIGFGAGGDPEVIMVFIVEGSTKLGLEVLRAGAGQYRVFLQQEGEANPLLLVEFAYDPNVGLSAGYYFPVGCYCDSGWVIK
jgi:hypothetical protein